MHVTQILIAQKQQKKENWKFQLIDIKIPDVTRTRQMDIWYSVKFKNPIQICAHTCIPRLQAQSICVLSAFQTNYIILLNHIAEVVRVIHVYILSFIINECLLRSE